MYERPLDAHHSLEFGIALILSSSPPQHLIQRKHHTLALSQEAAIWPQERFASPAERSVLESEVVKDRWSLAGRKNP